MICRSLQRQLILSVLLCAPLVAGRTSPRRQLAMPLQHHHFSKSTLNRRYSVGPSLHIKNPKHVTEKRKQISTMHHVHARGLTQAYTGKRDGTADLNRLAGSGGFGTDHLEAAISTALRSTQRAPERRSSILPGHSRQSQSGSRSKFQARPRTSGYRHVNRTHSAKPHRSGH
jgi:hypothetical protein